MTPAITALRDAGVVFGVHEYDHDASQVDYGREAADLLGLPPEQVFKTLVVEADGGIAVAIVDVGSQLSLKAVARALGSKRASMCSPDRATAATGYVVGGISPFGRKRPTPVVLDASALDLDVIYVSGGRRGLDLSIGPGDLVTVLDAVVAPIAA